MVECLPCPSCYESPEKTHGETQIMCSCSKHGHIAMGDTEYLAIKNWNKYVTGVLRYMPMSLRPAERNKIHDAIFLAVHDIDPKEFI